MTKDPYKYFRIEARELIDAMGRSALELERGGDPRAPIAALLRAAHTLKGAARIVKQHGIGDQAHHIEDLLTPHRTSPVAPADLGDAILRAVDAITALVGRLDAPAPAVPVATASALGEDAPETVRVELQEIDGLLNGIAEVSALLAQLRAKKGEEDRALDAGLQHVSAELQQVREAADRLRLMPIEAAFAPLERAARDAAQALGKRVTFQGVGGDLRLDAHVLEALRGALLHVVRNAVAHGIESPAERTTAGKPSAGMVALSVERRGSRIAIACRDDGAGIDLEAVRASAERAGQRGARALDAAQTIALLLRGGLSTRARVDDVAGRGVGLDVVRVVAERLRGEVSVTSEPGRGTTVELSVPTSLVAARALTVEAGGVVVSLPLDAVRRTLRIAGGAVAVSPERESILDEGRVIPFAPLHHLLGGKRDSSGPRGWSAVVLVTSEGEAAIGVDRLLGAADVVARPLPAFARADALVSGTTLDAQGDPRLVLEPSAVIAAVQAARPLLRGPERERLPILVVDDSLTTRMLEQAILESAGYTVELATSAEEALEKIAVRRYALLLVDVEMPGMDGFELLTRLQADPATRELPAVMVTSRGSADDRRRAIQAGARGHVVKGEFDQRELLANIRRWVA